MIKYSDTREMELRQQKEEMAENERKENVSLYSSYTGDDLTLRLYNETVDVVATIASSDDFTSPNTRIALQRFERLYWGQMAIGEPDEVTKAMVRFRAKLVSLNSFAAG